MNMIKSMSKTTKNNAITYAMVIIAFAVVQTMVMTGNITSLMNGLLVPLCTYVILAISLNLTVGILGELSLGHAGFMCVGAFSSSIFSQLTVDVITTGWMRFSLAIILGAIMAGLFGFLVGIPVLRLKGDYLAIVTLAFGEIVKNVINAIYVGIDEAGVHFSLQDVTSLGLSETGLVLIKGPRGITGTPKDSTFVIGVILIIITLIVILNLMNSRTGRAIMSIRDNRIAAESVGINITKYKLLAFAISAALAGVAGALYAHNLSTLTALPKNFGYNMSIMILVFVVLGGIGNIRGSIIAAVVLTLIPELLRSLNDYRMLMYAIVLIVTMICTWSPKIKELRERYSLQNWIQKKKHAKEVV
ncbi:branched-chain amino acid ABC transporter permease [Chakrabartyella piscis]|uniref:branched-chain amino acid ABC transporter permease n=1 Tax=Chakrabartyella piscis TaxID=2918914 RepID=UPI002958C340|nr:branched-chain amino acid ABC transporter permease [Chakrabartyella piscis]